ncbi:group III truncated hemoglobin [Kordiimonas aquimaris]|uniref:group III truncated hemoglobin n=1 Tax=Kordiimonas aquimaris TaxID=707591 RepID=UPI0021CFFCA9|nr:group III truncated hemoglobin [Kordiimonas aquimaris]
MTTETMPEMGSVPEVMIDTLVRRFYGEIQKHPDLGPIFKKAIPGDWEPHLKTMVSFWSSVMNTTGRYKGQPVPKHVALKGVEQEHFDQWLALFEDTAIKTCGADYAAMFMVRAKRIAQSLKFAMFGLPSLPNRIQSPSGFVTTGKG